jgi:hypothetical protein
MEALNASPFNAAVLANIAQCCLRLDQLDDCVEFCTRTLFVDENHVKALSRRATAWHRQKKLKEAASDMRRAFALDAENADIIEQHSIIVGDYEDSVTNSELDAALKETRPGTLTLGPSAIEELRFSLELFNKMDEQTEDEQRRCVQDAWVAYDLLLPFVERNEHVRAKFRTSGEMDKLCDRLVHALETPESGVDDRDSSRQRTEQAATSAMLNCAAAAVADTPRNQVVMFRHAAFRKRVLASFGALAKTSASGTRWMVLASLVRFLEQAVDSKSWKNAMMSSEEMLPSLFAALRLRIDDTNVPGTERASRAAVALAASSICFTLSSDNAGIQAFTSSGGDCLAAVAEALEMNRSSKDAASLRNVLGFMTNLSTARALREAAESNNCEDTRRKVVHVLLQIAQNGAHDSTCTERALGALLNLSCMEASQVRTHDLVEFGAVDAVERILTHASASTFSASTLVLSRAASLLCRLHAACRATKGEAFARLTSAELVVKLYAVCEHANASFRGEKAAVPDELWQLCAQVWCHLGWCAHVASVRAFLREKRAVELLPQVIALANAHKVYGRPSGETTACERLVGNVVKVLIAMQSDKDPGDAEAFRKKASLAVLVRALQELPDGLARKNVAILLAKMCQADAQVKKEVRGLRGIEMMLSVSQSLKDRPAGLSR